MHTSKRPPLSALLTLSISCVCALALMACDRQKDAPPAQTPDKQQEDAKNSGRVFEEIAWQSERPEVDKTLLGILDAAAQGCVYESGRPTDCDQERSDIAIKALEAKGLDALGTWTIALSSTDPSLHDYAVWSIDKVLSDEYFEAIEQAPEPAKEQAVARLLEVFARADAFTSARIARVTTHAAMINEKDAEWLEVTAKHPHREARVQAYRAAMKFGRLRPLDHLIAISHDKQQDRLLRQAALRAPLGMLPWKSSDEQEEVCSWIADFLPTKDSMFEEWPARLMPHCGESHIDALLDQTQARFDSGAFSPTFGETLMSFCTPKTVTQASPKQCERLSHLLVDAATAKSLDETTRAQVVRLLGARTPDEQTLRVLEKLAKETSTPESVREAARQEALPMREKLATP